MTLSRSIGARFDGTLGTTTLDVRKVFAGLMAPGGTGLLAWRQGVLPGCPATLVVGSATGWKYQVLGPATFAIARATNDGVHIFPNDGAVDVATVAAPGTSGASRWDVIWATHTSKTENGDTTSEPSFGCANGTPSTGVPSVPAIPAGCYEIARNLITNTASSTASAGNTLTQSWRYTALRGEPILVRNQAERDELTALATAAFPIIVDRLDTGQLERNAGAGWVKISTTAWAAYTPTLYGFNPGTAGSPVISTIWRRNGEMVDVKYRFIYGTAGVLPDASSGIGFSLPPVAPHADELFCVIGSGSFNRSTTTVWCPPRLDSGSLIRITDGTHPLSNVVNTTPLGGAYAVGDAFVGFISYRAA